MQCIWEPVGEGFCCINCGHVKKRESYRTCDLKKGFGDTIAGITDKLKIRKCGGCRKRQGKLNKRFSTPAYENARLIYTSELVHRAIRFCQQVPPEIDAICGVPRSGMIPAATIAANLHLPLYAVDDSKSVNYVTRVGSGQRLRAHPEPHRFLFVDDTVASGAALKKLNGFRGVTAAIYVNPRAKRKPDLLQTELELPHLLEWNLFNSGYVNRMAFDMDGVLCHDQPFSEPLENAKPRYLARRMELPAIITGRLESDRELTANWLKSYGIKCQRLIMFPGNEKERNKPQAVSNFKSEQFKQLNLDWFVESCPVQAGEIADLTGAWVICTGNGEVY